MPTLIYRTTVDFIGGDVCYRNGPDSNNCYPLNAIKTKFAVDDTCLCLCQVPCYLVN